MHDALLGSDQWKYFLFRVQCNPIIPLVPVADRLTEHGSAPIALVAVYVGLSGRMAKCFHDFGMWRKVRTADPKVDDFFSFPVHLFHFPQFPGEIVFFRLSQSWG